MRAAPLDTCQCRGVVGSLLTFSGTETRTCHGPLAFFLLGIITCKGWGCGSRSLSRTKHWNSLATRRRFIETRKKMKYYQSVGGHFKEVKRKEEHSVTMHIHFICLFCRFISCINACIHQLSTTTVPHSSCTILHTPTNMDPHVYAFVAYLSNAGMIEMWEGRLLLRKIRY